MPTPLTPDEEFDALFRRGLEHHPEQPETPAAWHRMDLLLDADLRQQALRRKVLRLLGAESVLLLLLLWLCWVVVPGHLPLGAAGEAVATQSAQPAATGPAPTSAKINRSGKSVLASPGASSQERSQPATTPPARLAAATATVAQPAEDFATQSTIAVKAPATAAHNTAASRHSASATRLLAANAAKGHRLTARSKTFKNQDFASDNGLIVRGKKHPETNAALVATATTTRRRGYPLPLAATQQTTEQLALSPRQNRKKSPTALATLSAASAAGEVGKNRIFSPGRRAYQWPTAERNGSLAAPAPRLEHQTGAASFGTGIDPLAPRWPVTNLAFALPDSLRPVALAARPALADSLLPRPLAQRYRLHLGLVAAPELSAVRPNRLAAPGPSVGVQLDYRLARRWHLSTAFLYSVKRYGAAGTDYTVPYALPHGWVIRDVDAVCRIIDIPLNLRYDLWQRPRYQVFASAGLSSLLMKREQYTYNYDPVYGRPVPSYAIEVDNGSRHLLKVLNLSAGYERLLGPRWAVQAEAFAKLPLAGVGYGAVRLRSAGVFFSLRYGLLAGRPATGQR